MDKELMTFTNDLYDSSFCTTQLQQTSLETKMREKKFNLHKIKQEKSTKLTAPKTCIQILYELKSVQPIVYELQEESGPAHDPLFTMCLKIRVNNEELKFVGAGSSKKLAKSNAAESALRHLVSLNNFLPIYEQLDIKNLLFTNIMTQADIYTSFDEPHKVENANKIEEKSAEEGDEAKANTINGKNPISALINLLQSEYKHEFELVREFKEDSLTFFEFKLTIKKNGIDEAKEFFANGSSKKQARTHCAQLALESLFNVKFDPNEEMVIEHDPNIPKNFKHEFANGLAEFIKNQYFILSKSVRSENANHDAELKQIAKSRTIYASIAQTINFDLTSLKLICITTGTKCINGEYMSEIGEGLNDCHAEILAIRVLRRYLYGQLEKAICNVSDVDLIFEYNQEKNLYCLKQHVKFHLYINTSPCGDGRIFCPYEISQNTNIDSHPKRKIRGLLRAKIESSEGTIPTRSDGFIQTWDGILGGERLRLMSCSDKLCKLNILGVQGALLSHVMKPIYLSSIIIGSFYHKSHLTRALYGRLEDKLSLVDGFQVNKPILSGITNVESRKLMKSLTKAMIWLLSDNKFEIINCKNGRQINDRHSLLCKREFFQLWSKIVDSLNEKNQHFNFDTISHEISYNDVKKSSKKYQDMKINLYKTFEQLSLGTWLCKPFEQDYFNLKL